MNYDKFQKQAIDLVEAGNSVIVCAPTGAGKTAIAEYVIEKCISQDKGVIYTAPIKALSNQKFRDFTRIYKQKIGILTGDVSLNVHAPVLIMTTEIFRNTLLEKPQRFQNISWVIFDEVHYLDDFERGTVWEESIIFCPSHIHILALSATIPNTKQIAGWIQKIHKYPIETVTETKRPVPLHHSFQYNNKIFGNIHQFINSGYRKTEKKRRRGKTAYISSNKISSLLKHIEEKKQIPVIYFAFSRRRCENLALKLSSFDFLDAEEKNHIIDLYKKLIKKFNLEKESSAKKLWPLVAKGIAYHHAGLLPSLKEVIEQLFTSRLIKLIFTTETFALGINMPAKTVIFDELNKFYGYYHGPLRCRDYYQMAGRAGRRSIDEEGFVYSRINPQRIELGQVKKVVFGQPEPILSQFNISYASLLHLYRKWGERLYEVYPLTLHHFQSSKKSRKNALALLHAKINLLREIGYIKEDGLSYKGEFASCVYGYELPITELFSEGVLEDLSSIGLNIVLASLVFEPRKNQLHVKLPSEILKIHKKINPLINDIIKKEKRYRIYPLSKIPYFNLAWAIERWCEGDSFSRIRTGTQADEGEIVRYFRMVIQILRQIASISFIDPSFKQRVQKALSMINRDEIDAEKQLREGL